MQVPTELWVALWMLIILFAVQTAISLAYLILEIIRDGRDHLESDQADALPDDTEWEVRA